MIPLLLQKIILTFCVFSLSPTYAFIFEQQDNNTTTYSDAPLQHAKIITPPATTSSPISTSPIQRTSLQKNRTPSTNYSSFLISSPQEQETIQNQISIPVYFKFYPPLKRGHTIQLFVDGKPYGLPTAAVPITINLLPRGEHHLTAMLLNNTGTVIQQSNAVTIYVHRASVNTSPAFKKPLAH